MPPDLPLPDYDSLPTSAIGSGARTLDHRGVTTLLEYEQGHANRPAVVRALQDRLDELTGDAAERVDPARPRD